MKLSRANIEALAIVRTKIDKIREQARENPNPQGFPTWLIDRAKALGIMLPGTEREGR